MARKPRKTQKKASIADFKSIFLDLTYIEEKAFLAEYEAGTWGIDRNLLETVELGWKISLSYSDHFEAYFASATYKGVNHDIPQTTAYVSRHSDPEKALGLLFRFVMVEVEDKGQVPGDIPREDEW